jgi:hypothetical protein
LSLYTAPFSWGVVREPEATFTAICATNDDAVRVCGALNCAVARPALPAPEPLEPTEAQIDAAEGWYYGDAQPPERKFMRPFIRGMARAILNAGSVGAALPAEPGHDERRDVGPEDDGYPLPAEHAPPEPSREAIEAALQQIPQTREIALERLFLHRILCAAYAVDCGSRPALAGRGEMRPIADDDGDDPDLIQDRAKS